MQPPLLIRLRSSAVALLTTALLAAGLLLMARLALRFAAWQPLVAAMLAGSLAAWCAVSFVVCSRPYKPLPRAVAAAGSEATNGKKAD